MAKHNRSKDHTDEVVHGEQTEQTSAEPVVETPNEGAPLQTPPEISLDGLIEESQTPQTQGEAKQPVYENINHTNTKEIRAAMLAYWDQMRAALPAVHFRDDGLGFLPESQAEQDYLTFYKDLRQGCIAGQVCTNEKKWIDHARWHLRSIISVRQKAQKKARRHLRMAA